jgi:hypothetical protein
MAASLLLYLLDDLVAGVWDIASGPRASGSVWPEYTVTNRVIISRPSSRRSWRGRRRRRSTAMIAP